MPSDDHAHARAIVVGMLNRGAAIDVPRVERAAGFTAGSFEQLFASVDALYAEIVTELFDGHRRECAAVGGVRRRSTTRMITTTFTAFLHHAHDRVDQHRAVQLLRLTRPDLPVTGDGGAAIALVDLPHREAEQWLHDVARTQAVTWNQPVPMLARLVVATMDGLVTDLIHSRQVAAVEPIAGVFAYQLAAWATRAIPSRPSAS